MSPTDALERRLRSSLEELQRTGLRRSPRPPAGVDLCSNDYLGLATHPLLKQRMAAAVCEEGCGSTGSRLLRGGRECFTAVENRFARFKGTERALYFSSGYLANMAVLTTLAESGDVIFSDERNHASLIDGARLSRAKRVVFPHSDVDALACLLAEERGAEQKFVVTESLFSMDGDFAPLEEYAALCRATNSALIVDEAHAVGIYGARGSGWIEECAAEDDVFLSINTAGKALGVAGAFVAGPEWAIEFLVQRARPFIFSTAPPPSVAAAIEASLDVIAGRAGTPEPAAGPGCLPARPPGWGGPPGPQPTSRSASAGLPNHPRILGTNERALEAALKTPTQRLRRARHSPANSTRPVRRDCEFPSTPISLRICWIAS